VIRLTAPGTNLLRQDDPGHGAVSDRFPMIRLVPSTALPHARHSSKDLARRTARKLLLAGLAVILFVVSAVAIAYHDLQSQVDRYDVSALVGGSRPTRTDAVADNYAGQAVNILVLGSDTRSGSNNVDGSEGSADVAVARSDTAMILHVSADRSRIEVVSIPRDTLVDIPSCTTADGTTTEASTNTQFNAAFANGAGTSASTEAQAAGAACTIKTVEQLTNIHIDEFVVVDFDGLSKMVDALGGVRVYVSEDINDTDYTGLVLKKGCYLMDGATALQYARVRHGVDDGSDLHRIERQQNLMSAMIRTAQSKNLLTSASDLYSFARSALSTLTTSQQIGSLTTLAGLAQSISSIGMSNITFTTMPNEPASWDANRVVPAAGADAVWTALRNDTPVPTESVTTTASGSKPTATATSTSSSTTSSSESTTSSSDSGATASATPTEDPAAQCH